MNKNVLTSSLRAGCVAVIISVVAVLIFALVAKFVSIDVQIIPVVNHVIKAVSIALGVLVVIKQKGLISGVISALIFTTLSLAIFLLLGGKFNFGNFSIDLIIAMVIGSICGIIATNRKK